VNVHGEIDITFAVYWRMTLSWLGVRLLVLRVLALATLVYATWIDIRDGRPGPWIVTFLICAVLFVLPELIMLVVREIQHRRVAGPTRFVVTGDGLVVDRPTGPERIAWRDVAQVQRGRYAWSVDPDGFHLPIIVPRGAFSPDDRRTINDFFLRHPEFAG